MYDPARGYPVIVPYLLYRDPGAAARWLCDVLQLREVIRFTAPNEVVGHVELERNGCIVSLGLRGGSFGEVSSVTLVFVDDIGAACDRARAAGGTVVVEPQERPWGLRQAVIADPEGQRWELSEHVRDVPAADWGARQLGPMPG